MQFMKTACKLVRNIFFCIFAAHSIQPKIMQDDSQAPNILLTLGLSVQTQYNEMKIWANNQQKKEKITRKKKEGNQQQVQPQNFNIFLMQNLMYAKAKRWKKIIFDAQKGDTMRYIVKEADLEVGKSQIEAQFLLRNFFKGWQFREFGSRFNGLGVVFSKLFLNKSCPNTSQESIEVKKSF